MRPVNRRTALGRLLTGAATLAPGAALVVHPTAPAASAWGRDRTEGTAQVVRYVRPQLYRRELASLQEALSGEEAGDVRKIVLSGTNDITAPLVLPSNCTLEGETRGDTLVRVPAGARFSAIDIDGRTGVAIRDLRVGHAGMGSLAGSSDGYVPGTAYGVWIRGDSEDVWLDGVEAEGFAIGISVSGGDGTAPGVCRSVHLHRCGAIGNGTFGINADEVDLLEIVDCTSHRNVLDGAKLRRRTTNVTLRGGSYRDNGQIFVQTGEGAGDGLDAFAGGDRFVVEGGVYAGNHGNGITIKTDNRTDSDPATFGYVRRIQVVFPRCNDNTLGSGLGIYTWMGAELGADIPTLPSVQHATVLGGEYSGNAAHGLYLSGHQIAVTTPMVLGNGKQGILLGERSSYTTITSPIVAANSTVAPDFWAGIEIHGRHVVIRGGSVLGVLGDEVTDEASLAAMPRHHQNNVLVDASASDVTVDLDVEAYSHSGVGIRTDMVAGVCVIHQRGAQTPNADLIAGSIGSTYLKTDAADPINAVWRKTSGVPNAVGGWSREAVGTVVTALPAAAAEYRGAVVQVEGGVGVTDATYVCRKLADETYAWQPL